MDVNVRDYGALGDDSHDDTAAFRNALAAIQNTGGTCFVPSGVYKIAPTGITNSNVLPAIKSDMRLIGEIDSQGTLLSSIHVHDKATKTIVLCSGSGWGIEKLRVIMPNIYETDTGAGPITVSSGDGWKIDNCEILNTGHFAIVARGTNFTISNNYILCTYADQAGAHPIHEGVIITLGGGIAPSNGIIHNNLLDGVGFNAICNNTNFYSNHIKNHGYNSGIFIGGANEGYSHDNILAYNLAEHGQEGIDDSQGGVLKQVSGYEVWSPRTLYFQNTATDNCGSGMSVGGLHSIVLFNRSVDNGKDLFGDDDHVNANGFEAKTRRGNNQGFNASYSLWIGNFATDTHAAGHKTQDYGLNVQDDNIQRMSIVENTFHGNNLGEGNFRNNAANLTYVKGRDVFYHLCDLATREKVRQLFNSDLYSITDAQYLILNKLFANSDLPRP